MRTRRHIQIAAAASTVFLAMSTAAPAFAADDDVVVTDRETVQVYMTPTGDVKVARIYDQVTATGQGTVTIANPVSTDDLRNLDGLSDLEVEDGKAVTELEVDGESRLRSVSSFDEDNLPVTITPTYELDGEVYEDPEDLVGKSGDLTVTYRVENVTSEPTTVTVLDGKGNEVEQTVDVPDASGRITRDVAPEGLLLDQVRPGQHLGRWPGWHPDDLHHDPSAAGRLRRRRVRLPARVEDAIIPRATVSIAVVQPLKNPSLATAAASYQGGADTGATLTAGAEQIDSQLLKLRDGAGQLLRGLIRLSDGARQLNDGLAGEAAPAPASWLTAPARRPRGRPSSTPGWRRRILAAPNLPPVSKDRRRQRAARRGIQQPDRRQGPGLRVQDLAAGSA